MTHDYVVSRLLTLNGCFITGNFLMKFSFSVFHKTMLYSLDHFSVRQAQ